ncbi:hypothetical protein QJS83_13550 [Bdellovibrio sp. 22V]|uniref:hypothetical protein n=1 Tax=Bdellovibrio TaxID=958 RepID=UPI0025435775|nr:hypothetical protein [Bdellovibrio sp. 22V]WII71489.1 hypothetical protein QJS83_13550 [Bdellovibrio sp. 22V]
MRISTLLLIAAAAAGVYALASKQTQKGPSSRRRPERRTLENDRVDETSDDSFPASDPPSWSTGTSSSRGLPH